ncbi:MAG: triphosphoribosyl-dephospho-CoA synthase [Bacteroidales bacterium]|jgi:holo-ACP synthase/triphosphoribosyl-dephospho-CoA synthase
MNDNDEIIKRILLAKEKRSLIKERIKNDGYASLSFSLNIPGYPKITKDISVFFNIVLSQFKIFLSANLIEITQEHYETDESGIFFLSSLKSSGSSIQNIKQLCETFEETHELGRLIDIDVTDSNGNYISSGRNKLCIFCKSFPAVECMRSERHNYSKLRKYIFEKIQNYLLIQRKEKVCNNLVSFAARAIFYEISLTPKPGLVDIDNSGIHKDMDYHTFIDSSSAIILYFYKIAEKGFSFNKSLSFALASIRETGLIMEKEMFRVTNGINTQKGIIFLMGVAVFASAKLIADKGSFDLEKFSDMTMNIGKNILNEFDAKSLDETHGKICVEKYGKHIGGGARQEVASGFNTAIKFGLPMLSDYELEKINSSGKQKVLFNALLLLIGNNNDTNVIYRSSLEVLEKLKSLALKTFNSLTEDDKKNNYKIIETYCLENNISPGGSADLLAIVVFLYFVKKTYSHEC